MRGRGMIEEFFLDGIPVEPATVHSRPGDAGPGTAAGFQVAGEAFDVGAARLEHAEQMRWSQVEDQVVAWLRAADQYAALGGVIDRGGGVADCSGHDGCLAGVAHSGAA
jgi:hypothetical protein